MCVCVCVYKKSHQHQAGKIVIAIDRLSVVWKPDLYDIIKQDFLNL